MVMVFIDCIFQFIITDAITADYRFPIMVSNKFAILKLLSSAGGESGQSTLADNDIEPNVLCCGGELLFYFQ